MSASTAPSIQERRDQVRWFLRATVTQDEAEGMASAGYRSLPCGGCARMHCEFCDRDPIETVRGGASSGKRGSDARHVRAVVARFGQFPRPVLINTYREVGKLPPLDRLVLLLHDGAGLDQAAVGRHLKISRSTVQRVRERALGEVVRRVWEETSS